jgi:cell division protein FtsB
MDFRVRHLSKLKRFPSPEDGLRTVVARARQAEALAASWIERSRPVWTRIYALRRRIATIAVLALACSLFVHVMFGANGMVIYKQKRAEREALQKRIIEMQRENDRYTQEIQGLKSDQQAIEKEAREQLGYAKPGEYVYVPPSPTKPAAQNHTAKK